MSGEEFIVAVVGIIAASTFAIFLVAKITGLIKTWINRNNSTYSDEEFEKLARAFVQHKKEITTRIQNLEAVVSDKSEEHSKKLQEKKKSIEIESGDPGEKERESNRGNLRNMLKE